MIKNNKNILIGVAALVVVLIVGGVYLVTRKSAITPVTQTQEQTIAILKPEDIGLMLSMSADGKSVILEIEKTDDIVSIDYELSYTSTGEIPRGAIGHIDVVAGKKITKEITLGTCSDVCHYDEGVSNIKIVVKVTKSDGNVFQVEESL